MRWTAVGPTPLKLELDVPNEERASRRLSGKAAGLYKRPAGRTPVVRIARGVFTEGYFGRRATLDKAIPRGRWPREIIAAPTSW